MELYIAAKKDAYEAGLKIPPLAEWESQRVSLEPTVDRNMVDASMEKLANVALNLITLSASTRSPAMTETDTTVNLKATNREKATSNSDDSKSLLPKSGRVPPFSVS
ncbi:hypothetical protein LTR17_024454 [Elasticomyces elasticus]|nr:hypothetical protein LTR17_024454 [Elasticomyces elasticus]